MSSPRSLAEIAELIGGNLEGDGEILISGVADLQGAGPSEISFLAHPRYEAVARQTRAGALVVGPLPDAVVREPPTDRTGVWDPLPPRSQSRTPPAATAAIMSQSVVLGRFMGCSR